MINPDYLQNEKSAARQLATRINEVQSEFNTDSTSVPGYVTEAMRQAKHAASQWMAETERLEDKRKAFSERFPAF